MGVTDRVRFQESAEILSFLHDDFEEPQVEPPKEAVLPRLSDYLDLMVTKLAAELANRIEMMFVDKVVEIVVRAMSVCYLRIIFEKAHALIGHRNWHCPGFLCIFNLCSRLICGGFACDIGSDPPVAPLLQDLERLIVSDDHRRRGRVSKRSHRIDARREDRTSLSSTLFHSVYLFGEL